MEVWNPTTYEYHYNETPPAFNTAIGPPPDNVKERLVWASITLVSGGALTGSSVEVEVETGVGTGSYERIGIRCRTGTDHVGAVTMSCTFPVLRGHRYRFREDGAGAGSSRTFTRYGYRDEVGP